MLSNVGFFGIQSVTRYRHDSSTMCRLSISRLSSPLTTLDIVVGKIYILCTCTAVECQYRYIRRGRMSNLGLHCSGSLPSESDYLIIMIVLLGLFNSEGLSLSDDLRRQIIRETGTRYLIEAVSYCLYARNVSRIGPRL